jgi:hypothetical protein
VDRARLRLIEGHLSPAVVAAGPRLFQAGCVEAFVASWTARGFADSTIDNDTGVLERMLAALGRPAWEVTAEDVDRVVGDLASAGRAVSTRRNYLQVFKGFHRFLEVRKACHTGSETPRPRTGDRRAARAGEQRMSESFANIGSELEDRDQRRVVDQIDTWRKQLINLARSNGLLYFRHTRMSTLEIARGPGQLVEVADRLLAGGSWRFYEPPRVGRRRAHRRT